MRHPSPPGDLHARPLPLVSTIGPFVRIYDLTREPIYFGRSGRYRFDAPSGEYGVLYCGADIYCAFIETFGHATGINLVGLGELGRRGFVRIEASRELRLVDLTASGLARLGADNQLCTGDYAIAQQWALALHRHPDQPDGIYLRARHDPSRMSAAVFDRAAGVLTATPLGTLADQGHVELLRDILDTYGFGLT